MEEKELLIQDFQDSAHTIQICSVPEDKIPEYLNGESGFHIYHVRMLTELILRQLLRSGHAPGLSEEDIQAIAVASSLHDVGKAQIPASILDNPDRLSPVEYDIIKKHTLFGEKMIVQATAEQIPANILEYARQIALYHHERIDGTGYPFGLQGTSIPLCSQVVALADAYDALTSNRNYKQAYSQDVSVQMIASGMCGVFAEELVDSLIHVVNDSSLISLRKRIQEKRQVVSPEISAPKQVLCVGNTAYVTRELVDTAFPGSHVVIMGNSPLKSGGRIKVLAKGSNPVQTVFDTYEFDMVVYFSAELTYHSQTPRDGRLLDDVLSAAAKTRRPIRVLYLSCVVGCHTDQDPAGILASSFERLCRYYADRSALDIKILQLPYLYSGTCAGDYLHGLFEQLYQGKPLLFTESPQEPLLFLSAGDLADLLLRVIEGWIPGSGVLSVPDGFHLTFQDLADGLMKLKRGDIRFSGTEPIVPPQSDSKVLRSQYGWVAKVSLIEDLSDEYSRYLAACQVQGSTKVDRLRRYFQKHSRFIALLELLLLHVLTESLVIATGSAATLVVVDFRMAYIVIMALTHGLSYGLAASGLSSLAWLVTKLVSGTNWLTIFYEPNNWLGFVYYFLIGALCGYIRIRYEDKLRFSSEEKHLLEEKLIFTRELYDGIYHEKRDLKKQIIGSRDSFGKIFDIARKLDTVEVPMLYLRAVETFETVLENKSVAIYSVNPAGNFGRLEVASRDTMEAAVGSISLSNYAPILSAVAGGEIWRNTSLDPDFPMYAAGIHRDGELVMLIFLWRADAEQQTLYYVNLFKILKDLVQMSLLRALQYNQAIYDTQYLPGTSVLTRDAFSALLANARELEQRKVARFLLLDLDASAEAADRFLAGKVRQNDALGLLENGHVGILLSQATEAELDVILARFGEIPWEITAIT